MLRLTQAGCKVQRLRRAAGVFTTAAMFLPQQAAWRAVARYGAFGIEIVICMVLGSWGGHGLDVRWGTAPYLTLGGFVLGLGAAGLSLWKMLQFLQRQDNP